MSKLPDYLIAHLGINGNDQAGSGATSPGADWRDDEGELQSRYRPRLFPYFQYLPYEVEGEEERQQHLDDIVKNLYVSVAARDFSPGAVRWSRELRNWLELKFDPPRKARAKLVKLYYELAMAPGLDPAVSERFASMFMTLTKRKHYLRPGKDLILDWRPIYNELKTYVLPQESGYHHTTTAKRNVRTLTRMCTFAQFYFDPEEITTMFEEILPYFTTSNIEGAFIVVGLLNLLFPTGPSILDKPKLQPGYYLPSQNSRSRTFDVNFLDLLSRLARDLLPAYHVSFGPHGIFTAEQSKLIFTAILRLLEIPVGQSTSPYSSAVDANSGVAMALDRDQRKNPVAYHIARYIVMSLSPQCENEYNSVLSSLEGLIQAVETFFHPSNSGAWTKTLSQLVYYLSDFFVMRWNRENSGELELPENRRLTPKLKDRFVLCLREVVFMGIYSKSTVAMNFSLSCLQSLAYLQPKLILPGALQRIYPSMQGLVEVHRTASSLRALQVLSRSLVTARGFRCHVTTLLGLALPGIDANDLDKTLHTLSLIQTLAYNVPFHDLSQQNDDSMQGSHIALEWVTSEAERLEREGADVHINYDSELSDEVEQTILKSSTAGFSEWVISFLGRVFTLLENLPDSTRVRSGSPEEHVMNTLPATFTPLFAALSPELYTISVIKITDFVNSHVIHQARDAMAFICNSMCKVNPEEGLKHLVPVLVRNIRAEIEENDAASTRNTGSDVLPRDRGLVWNISILSMCIVHVGDAVLKHQDNLFTIASYLQHKCKGIPAVHVSNFVHHLLLNLTVVYTRDYDLVDSQISGVETWGNMTDPKSLTIKWHVPSQAEIEFALKLFRAQAERAVAALESLTSENSPIKRDGTGKEWSDELTRNLVLVRLALSGISMLFDPQYARDEEAYVSGNQDEKNSSTERDDDDESFSGIGDEDTGSKHRYPAAYSFEDVNDPVYIELHQIRHRIGIALHHIHVFLTKNQEDDVACFSALYTTYRAWFVDVGLERSAHILERVTRLFAADIQTFKISGLRKCYPRPLLLRRANLYHLQRLKHNSGPRPQTAMDRQLLLDLAESCVSLYTEIRRHAQAAGESATKIIIGSRPTVIPQLLKAFEDAVKTNDYRRMKGAMFTLLYGSLAKTAGKDWRYTPTLIKLYISASTADKPSVQKLAAGAVYHVMDYGRPLEKVVLVNEATVRTIAPDEDLLGVISEKRARLQKKRNRIEERKALLALELVEIARNSHWKTATRTVTIIVNLGLRFGTIAPDSLLELATLGTIDTHPGLRGLYSGALVALFCLIEMRAVCDHEYTNFLRDKFDLPHKITVETHQDDPNWTKVFLSEFKQQEAKYYIDHDYPGWLVWNKEFPAYKADIPRLPKYDDVEDHARRIIGKQMDRKWFNLFFAYLKQEPRDGAPDRFRMASSMLLQFAFDLVCEGTSIARFQDIEEETNEVLGDGSDKHQHRATAEILAALVCSCRDSTVANRDKMWGYVFPIVKKIFEDGLTPENSSYWTSFLHLILQGKDLRRSWPIVEWLSSFRLDMSSNAAFKESSKIQLLHQCIAESGWHFQLHQPILENFLNHLDHPYKGVREAMGGTLGLLYRTRHHVSYKNVSSLMDSQSQASSVGKIPYQPSKEFQATVESVFKRLENWRHQRLAGQQTPSSYTSASKTVLLWLESTLSSHECTNLIQFAPRFFMSEMLHMMDVKEDPELMSLAYHVFRHLPNIPHPADKDHEFIESLIQIGKTSALWHQRLRVLINMQVLYFRRLFLIASKEQERLFTSVSNMLEDNQLEVRLGASATLSGMIRCSPVRLREDILQELKEKFTDMLVYNPLPKRSQASTPTPDYSRVTVVRHAAVLGLAALVQAFPYISPPPSWLPEVLATLASKAAADPGMVGKSVKSALGEFKKTRQDTWHVDVKAFNPEQLEDLEGVLWKSYFA